MTEFKVFHLGNMKTVSIGQSVTAFKCGSGRSVFVMEAKLVRATTKHLVFKTTAGDTIKTPIENTSYTIGKANKQGVGISLESFEDWTKRENTYVTGSMIY